MAGDKRPLIAHVIYRLDVGGLQNGVVNLINRLPADRFRHVVICATDYTDFRDRIQRDDVEVYALHKQAGQDFGLYLRLFRLLRRLRPALLHSRNLATVECQLSAWLARVPCRVHGEHGWDVNDPDGNNRKYQWLRRMFIPFVHRYVPLSRELERYLVEKVGVPDYKITRIYNGVDTERFNPQGKRSLPESFGVAEDLIVIGTVGRMHGVKDQLTLVRAFTRLTELVPEAKDKLRLVLVGDGPLRVQAEAILSEYGVRQAAWLPGEREDIPDILRAMDLFVLPSSAEGISNTVLEAMASGLPVVATAVGGNPELVQEGECGALVPPGDPAALADVLAAYVRDPERLRSHGEAARVRAETQFSLAGMLERYARLYDTLLRRAAQRVSASEASGV